MGIKFYMDVHVPVAITEQLRRRDIDVLTAIEDDARLLTDDELLERARELGRVVFTQDIGFKASPKSGSEMDAHLPGFSSVIRWVSASGSSCATWS